MSFMRVSFFFMLKNDYVNSMNCFFWSVISCSFKYIFNFYFSQYLIWWWRFFLKERLFIVIALPCLVMTLPWRLERNCIGHFILSRVLVLRTLFWKVGNLLSYNKMLHYWFITIFEKSILWAAFVTVQQ